MIPLSKTHDIQDSGEQWGRDQIYPYMVPSGELT